MLDIIPTEIFINVINFLSQSDKARLLLVSHRWHRIIRDSVLMDDLVIQQPHIDSIIQMIEDGTIDGTKVKRLDLKNQDYSFLLYHKLHASFPRVWTLVWKQPSWSCFDSSASSPERVECKSNSIELAGFEKCIWHLLENTTFTNLTSIALQLYDKKEDAMASQRIVSAFIKMPSLQKIHLDGFRLHLSQFETLHQCLPKLSKINLSNVVFKSTLGHDLTKIDSTSASAVKSFKVNGDSRVNDEDLTWIDYFSKKYANVYEFEFDCHVPFCDNIQSTSDHFHLCQTMHSKLLSHFTANLTTYIVPNKPMGTEVLMCLAKSKTQLKKLKFEYSIEGSNAFRDLEQIRSVEELEITDCTTATKLPKMENLKKLVMGCDLAKNDGKLFYLDTLMINSHTYHIEIQAPCISLSKVIPSTFTSLQCLILRTHSLDNNIWHYISQHCPLLKEMELYLTSVISPDNTTLFINLPNHSLRRVLLRVKRDCHYYKLMTKSDIRWFELKFGMRIPDRVNEIPDYEYEWLEEQYFASIRCQSISIFDIDTF
ncbi:hypothetical protein K501DRAFT_309945 [Backusella circina FSU 941]|nr:hypothetical protein K501DRAFT_309945 [Backusella circina FSU 941]